MTILANKINNIKEQQSILLVSPAVYIPNIITPEPVAYIKPCLLNPKKFNKTNLILYL